METRPLVSIIMNCHNGERFLKEAINSVYDQTYSYWEIIFWDNFSSDKSAEIAMSYDERVKYFFNQKKTSLGEARNLAMNKASGKYVCFLDCDDMYFPTKLELQVKMMESENYALGYAGAKIIDERGKHIRNFPAKNKSGHIFRNLLKHYEINMQSVILRQSYLIDNELNFNTNMSYCPDHNLFMNIASSNEVGVLQDYLVKYRLMKNSLSSKTMKIAGSEVRLTINEIAEKKPDLNKMYKREFLLANAKGNYYDSIASIHEGDYVNAKRIIFPFITLRLEYFVLYLLLFLKVPNDVILKLLHRKT